MVVMCSTNKFKYKFVYFELYYVQHENEKIGGEKRNKVGKVDILFGGIMKMMDNLRVE